MKLLLLLLAAVLPLSAGADAGHPHGDEPSTAVGKASPRIEAHSDLFELVGIVEAAGLTIYLDRFRDNTPVTDARLEIEVQSGANQAPIKAAAEARPDGTYLFKGDFLAKPGSYALQISITAGSDVDILAGNLDIANPDAGRNPGPTLAAYRNWIVGGALVLAGVAAAFFLLRRRRTAGAPS